MAIGEICSRQVAFVERSDSVAAAAQLMLEHHVGSLVVIDVVGGKTVPVGMFTDRDIAVGVVARGLAPAATAVGDVMGPDVNTVREHAGVGETLALMRLKGVRRLPVVDAAGTLVGLIAADDLLSLLAEEMSGLAGMISREERQERAVRRAKL